MQCYEDVGLACVYDVYLRTIALQILAKSQCRFEVDVFLASEVFFVSVVFLVAEVLPVVFFSLTAEAFRTVEVLLAAVFDGVGAGFECRLRVPVLNEVSIWSLISSCS